MRIGENLFTLTFTSPHSHAKTFAPLDKLRCFPDQKTEGHMSSYRYRSQLLEGTLLYFHSLMRERTG